MTVPGPALLFCPGDRPERFARAAEVADGAILDLEDGVAPADKAAARAAVAAADLDRATTVVRINPVGTREHREDLAMVRDAGYGLVMLPKTETRSAAEELTGLAVIALCETAAGVLKAAEIAEADNVTALMWGAEDLMASIGGSRSRRPDGAYNEVSLLARSMVLLATGAAGRAAIDAVHLDIGDRDGLLTECLLAVSDGFTHKACVHPAQVPVVTKGFAPTQAQVEWADAVLAEALASPNGAFAFRGSMVDEPLLRQARAILARNRPRPGSSTARPA
ncbi:CoA ester lyase [Streptomyces sp. E5N91]|uniref:HpcH/HpaI aldolase/citrate lyase family protein n=1 Tax=Streptomyces sp. E5N91 TaxID=1851996 RepID=UPI000EF6082D|nr:CoA ester lyase [Streptomyces sp. E5N91]